MKVRMSHSNRQAIAVTLDRSTNARLTNARLLWGLLLGLLALLALNGLAATLGAQEAAQAGAGAQAAQPPANQPPAPIETLSILPKFVVPTTDGSETKDEARKIRAQASAVRKLLSSTKKKIVAGLKSGNVGSVTTELDEYLNGYLFPRMAQKDPLALSDLGNIRREFTKDFLSDKVALNARKTIIESYAIPKIQQLLKGNFHPAVKLNAVVLLGMLNDAEGTSAKILPRPSNSALTVLVEILTQESYSPELKVAALAGIVRHVDTDRHATPQRIDQATRDTIANQCIAILDGKHTDQENWPEALNYWMKRRATQTLGAIATPGPDNAYAKKLVTVLEDDQNSIWLRLDALMGLAKMDIDQLDADTVKGITMAAIAFTENALDNEANRLEHDLEDLVEINILLEDKDLIKSGSAKRKKDRSGPAAGMGFGEGSGGGGEGSSASGPEGPPKLELPVFELNDARRRAKAYVFATKHLLENSRRRRGLVSVAKDDTLTTINKTLEVLNRLMKESDTGIIDLSKKQDDEEDDEDKNKEAITKQLTDIFRQGAADLRRLGNRAAPQPADDFADVGSDDKKAADQAAPDKPAEGNNQ